MCVCVTILRRVWYKSFAEGGRGLKISVKLIIHEFICKVFVVGNVCGMVRTMKFMVLTQNNFNIRGKKCLCIFISQSSHHHKFILAVKVSWLTVSEIEQSQDSLLIPWGNFFMEGEIPVPPPVYHTLLCARIHLRLKVFITHKTNMIWRGILHKSTSLTKLQKTIEVQGCLILANQLMDCSSYIRHTNHRYYLLYKSTWIR